jgi:molybdate transport system substrate-binding protein
MSIHQAQNHPGCEMQMNYFSRILLLIAFTVLFPLCVACAEATTNNTATLNVFAAASLSEPFKEIATQYQKARSNIKITYNFNGSQILVQQLINGASADLFASADLPNMQKASNAGLIENDKIFAKNRLAVIIPASNPGNIQSLKDLAKKGLKIVVAAPAVPVGKYSLQVLDKMKQSTDYGLAYVSMVKANVVSEEENVKSVVQKVQLGEADAGIVYHSDVTTAVADKVKLITIPDNCNIIAEYPLAVIKNSRHASEAQELMHYILSKEGQAVLLKHHFINASPSAS